jgi:hypothetical protein
MGIQCANRPLGEPQADVVGDHGHRYRHAAQLLDGVQRRSGSLGAKRLRLLKHVGQVLAVSLASER